MNDNIEIFISYAWGIEREEIVDKLYDLFKSKGYNIIRDKINLGYKGSITDFMNRIGNGKIVVLIISDKYLKSENCMYEIVQIKNNGKFNDRIFPIVLSDANFYKPINRLAYIKHWETEIQKLNEEMKGISDMSVIGDIQKELQNYRDILNTISNIMFVLKDMNTLTPDIHKDNDFSIIINSIEKRIAEDYPSTTITKENINTKTDIGFLCIAYFEKQIQKMDYSIENVDNELISSIENVKTGEF